MIHPSQSSLSNSVKMQNSEGFQMVSTRHGRIDGSVPVWGKTAQSPDFAEEIARSIETHVAKTQNASPLPSHGLSFQNVPADIESSSSFGFFDLLDIINPLQHIPIVGTLYRNITGDEIGSVAQVIGGAIFGGPIGAAAGFANAVISHETGKDVCSTVIGLFSDDSPDSSAQLEGTSIAFADLTGRTRSPYNE